VLFSRWMFLKGWRRAKRVGRGVTENDFQSSECAERSWTAEARSGRADEKSDCRLSDQ
jgi:hypothetical protein